MDVHIHGCTDSARIRVIRLSDRSPSQGRGAGWGPKLNTPLAASPPFGFEMRSSDAGTSKYMDGFAYFMDATRRPNRCGVVKLLIFSELRR